MRGFVLLLLISLLIPIVGSSQTTYPVIRDSIVLITPSQLKTTNLIFNEHSYLKKENSLLKDKISTLENINSNYEKLDSLNKIKYESNIKHLNFIIKKKKVLNTCLGSGIIISLLLLLLK